MARFAVVVFLALAVACNCQPPTSKTDAGAGGGSGGGEATGGSSGGGAGGGAGGSGGSALSGHSGFSVVAGGVVAHSESFRVIMTTGSTPGGTNESSATHANH